MNINMDSAFQEKRREERKREDNDKNDEEKIIRTNNIENSKISVNWNKEEVCEFLLKLNLEQKILDKIKNEEIDGDALILIIKNDYKFPTLKVALRKTIAEYLETDIFTLKNNIKENELYKDIYTENIDKLWEKNKLKNKLANLKLGDKLKFIKYLILRDPPPEIEKKSELNDYLNKIIKNEDNINDIQDTFKDLLEFNENEINQQCENWELDKDDIFKLKIIIKIIKQNINKSSQKEGSNNNAKNDKLIDVINGNKINEIHNDIKLIYKNKKIQEEYNYGNNRPAPNSLNIIELVTPVPYEEKSNNYSFYCVVEAFIYDTSQREKTYGLRNPKTS